MRDQIISDYFIILFHNTQFFFIYRINHSLPLDI